MNSCRQPGRHPTRNCNKLSFLVFLENIPVYSEARLNKRVDCVLLGVGGAWCVIAFKSMRCPSADTLCPFGGYSLWDHEGNSSSHSISERYTLMPPYASRSTVFSVFVCFRLASSVSWTLNTYDRQHLLYLPPPLSLPSPHHHGDASSTSPSAPLRPKETIRLLCRWETVRARVRREGGESRRERESRKNS